VCGSFIAALSLAVLAGAPPAFAEGSSWWRLNATSAPSLLPREGEGHDGEAQIVITATDFGDQEVNASEAPVTLTDKLPEGVEPVKAVGLGHHSKGAVCAAHEVVVCTFKGKLPPYTSLTVLITVHMHVTNPAATSLLSVVTAEGGGTPGARLERQLKLEKDPGEKTPFGVEGYELAPESEAGLPGTEAGSHPFQLTTTINLNQTLDFYNEHIGDTDGFYPSAPALPDALRFKLPPGLVADTSAEPRCSDVEFTTIVEGSQTDLCPPDTAIGVANVLINFPNVFGVADLVVPLFNLTPSPGEPARFGFEVEAVPVVLNASLPAGGEYAAEVSTSYTDQAAQFLSGQVTVWGVPGDPRHDNSRGWECLENGERESAAEHPLPCTPEHQQNPTAYLTLPTSCSRPLTTSVSGSSWPTGEPGNTGSELAGENTTFESPSRLTGCGSLAFEPSITAHPELHSANTPTGLTVGLHMPQESLLAAGGVAEAAIKATTVALPEGLQASPAAASGLLACTGVQVGLEPGYGEGLQMLIENDHFSPEAASCPEAAKVGTVTIDTPLLEDPLKGGVYLASQDTNPFASPLVLYLLAEDPVSGVRVKLAGEVRIDPVTGQLTSEFKETPPLPFSDVTLKLFGGPRAAQSTPPLCGSYTTTASFSPWSGATPAQRATNPSEFVVEQGANGGPCQYVSPLTFSPAVSAGPTSSQAGAFTDFTLTIEHGDGDQSLTGVEVHLPAGAAALLSKLTPCQEPPAGQEWSCGPESEIGESTASSGLGSEPVSLKGRTYLTTGYDGAPFGLLVATLAKTGPFNLGMVYVRSRINVNPTTAAVTITTDPGPHGDVLPTILKGVPVQLKSINVTVDRPEFEFNPTNCNPTSVTGESMSTTTRLAGSQGGSREVSASYPVSNCATLPFEPKLTAEAGGHGSKVDGTNLHVKVASAGLGQANIAKVDLQLPKGLSSRLTTLQKACTEAAFAANPASCDPDSIVGHATVRTPILKSPLTGPAILVSHGGAEFPDLEFVLQGEGIKLVLDGKTDIKKDITYSKFETAPDAPFTIFETELPAGPDSVLTPNVAEKEDFSLCKTSLAMPTTITAQNGAVIEQSTQIAISGCGGVQGYKVTKAQLLAKALKVCRKDKTKGRRRACEKQARKKYGVKGAKASKGARKKA
jgi:hypothetical protein